MKVPINFETYNSHLPYILDIKSYKWLHFISNLGFFIVPISIENVFF